MILFLVLALGACATADKLDRTYLPPPGSKFAGGSHDSILPPIEFPKEPSVSASTIRPIVPGFPQQPIQGSYQDINTQSPERSGVFGTQGPRFKAPVGNQGQRNPQLPEVTSYSEVTSQPGFVSSHSSATSVTPSYNPYTVPTTTTSYAFSQTTTYSPIDDECFGSTCAYEQDGFVDSGIEPEISISHQAPDRLSQTNQAFEHRGRQGPQGPRYQSTQSPVRIQTSSPETVSAQRFNKEGQLKTYLPAARPSSPPSQIHQQTQGFTSQYPSRHPISSTAAASLNQRLDQQGESKYPGVSQTQYDTNSRNIDEQPLVQTYDHQGRPIPNAPRKPSQSYDNITQRPIQRFDQQGRRIVSNIASQIPGTGQIINAPGQQQSSQTFDQHSLTNSPIQPQYGPLQSFDEQGRPIVSDSHITDNTQYPGSTASGQSKFVPQNVKEYGQVTPQSINEFGKPITTISGQPQHSSSSVYSGEVTEKPFHNFDNQGSPIASQSSLPKYPGAVSSNSAGPYVQRPIASQTSDAQRPGAMSSQSYPGNAEGQTVFDHEGHVVPGASGHFKTPSTNFGPSTPIPITSIAPSGFPSIDQTDPLAPGPLPSSDQLRPQFEGASNRTGTPIFRPQTDSDRNAVILNYDNIITPEGEFAYSYDTSNGIHADENGTAIDGVKAQGSYSYTGDDGKFYSIVYTADENGYQPHGDHLPTPPPIPEEILRVIEKVRYEEAAGDVDDGLYDENKYGYKKYQGAMDRMHPDGFDTTRFTKPKYITNGVTSDGVEQENESFPESEYNDDGINVHTQASDLPIRGRPSIGQRLPQQTSGDRVSSIKPTTPSSNVFSEAGTYTNDNQINHSLDSVPGRRPVDRFQNMQSKHRPPTEINKSGSQIPSVDNDNKYYEEEYINNNGDNNNQQLQEGNKYSQHIPTKNTGGVISRPSQNKPEYNEESTQNEEDGQIIPQNRYDNHITQNKQRIPLRQQVGGTPRPGQRLPSNDDQQYLDQDNSYVKENSRQQITQQPDRQPIDNRVNGIKQHRPSTMRITIQGRPKVKDSNRFSEETRQEPTRQRLPSSDRIPQQRPSFDASTKRPYLNYQDTNIEGDINETDDDYIESEGEISNNGNLPVSGLDTQRPGISRRPAVQPIQSVLRKDYDNSIQASTRKPSIVIQGEDNSNGYQYIPPRNKFDQNNRQESIPFNQKHKVTTLRPFATPDAIEATQFKDDSDLEDYQTFTTIGQQYTKMPLGYFDSARNVTFPKNQQVFSTQKDSLRPYNQENALVPSTSSPIRRPMYNQPPQRQQGTLDNISGQQIYNTRPGFSTASTPTASFTRYPTTSVSRLPQNKFASDVHETYSGGSVNEPNVTELPSGDLGQSSPSESTYFDSGSTSAPIFASTGRPMYSRPAYEGQTSPQLPGYSPIDRNTGVKFVDRYTPSVAVTGTTPSYDSSTVGRVPAFGDRRGSQQKVQRPGVNSTKGPYFEQTVQPTQEGPHRPTTDEYGRPISTQDHVKGEDFRGPKQPQSFDPETGYHY